MARRRRDNEVEIEVTSTQVVTRRRIGQGVWEERTHRIGERPHQWVPGTERSPSRREGDD